MKKLLLLLALVPVLTAAAPQASPSRAPRPRIGDFERGPDAAPSLIKRIEAALPIWLLVFLGFHGDVRLEAQTGPVTVSAGTNGR